MLAAVDVLAPCALGAVLDHESVPALQAPVVAGAANNQLADESVADLLAAPRRPVGAGLRRQRRRHHQHLGRARARRLRPAAARASASRGIGDTLRSIYDAAAGGMTPLAAAMELARTNLSASRA